MEKRRFRRFDTNFLVRIKTIPVSDTELKNIEARMNNISLGGVFISTPYPFSVGSIVKLSFTLPGNNNLIEAEGIVRWISNNINNPGMGIEFLNISFTDRESISDYIKERMQKEVIQQLIQTPKHKELLKLWKAHTNEEFSVKTIMVFLSVEEEQLKQIIEPFVSCELISLKDNKITFEIPHDKQLEKLLREIQI